MKENEEYAEEMLRRQKSMTQDRQPGDIILSRDGKTQYQIQKDGSWRKVQDQEPGDLEKLNG